MDMVDFIKLLMVGPGAAGKTSMLITYTTNEFPREYVPTVFDNFEANVLFEGRELRLSLWDSMSRDGPAWENRLLRLSFPETDVIVIVCSVVSPYGWSNALPGWHRVISHQEEGAADLHSGTSKPPFNPLPVDVKVLVVGSKIDLRDDPDMVDALQKKGLQVISREQGEEYTKKYDYPYVECSSLTKQGLKEVFDTAMRLALQGGGCRRSTGSTKARRCVLC